VFSIEEVSMRGGFGRFGAYVYLELGELAELGSAIDPKGEVDTEILRRAIRKYVPEGEDPPLYEEPEFLEVVSEVCSDLIKAGVFTYE
jgi:hypothetical protein